MTEPALADAVLVEEPVDSTGSEEEGSVHPVEVWDSKYVDAAWLHTNSANE